MTRTLTLTLALLFLSTTAFKQDEVLYRLFNSKGGKIEKKHMLEGLEQADVVFFGELHNDAIGHYLEKEVLEHLYKTHGSNLIMGCEMFEADDQLKLSEYISGSINAKTFEEEARLWKNYKPDYKPLFEYAREHQIPTIATNIPRRYASMVYKGGFEALDSLSDDAHRLIAPLPITFDTTVACYKNLLASAMPGHGSPNLAKAQAIKDATMAHFILENLNAGKRFYHFNGAYHSNNYEGIVWYLKRQNPELKIKVISMVEQSSIENLSFDNLNVGNYILVTHPDFPKSY